ncbi:MAG: hypothetical protein AAB484_01460 [Patescibacteria group bacterium]
MYLKNLVGKILSRGPVSVTLAVVLSVLVVTATVGAATTISTNINTAGTLTVTGASTLTGDVAAGGALTVTGATALNGSTTIGNAAADNITIAGHATSSQTFATLGNFYVNGYATTTASTGAIATEGALTVTGATALNGSTTIGNAAADNITIAGHATSSQTFATLGNFYVNGYATTTASTGAIATEGGITVGTGGTAMTRIYKGTCNLTGMDGVHNASTTKAYGCAVTGVVSGDLVFTQLATSTAFATDTNWQIVGAMASSTAGQVDVLIWHSGQSVAPSVTGVGSSTRYLIIR